MEHDDAMKYGLVIKVVLPSVMEAVLLVETKRGQGAKAWFHNTGHGQWAVCWRHKR